jgi:hypothetical protein
MSNAAPVPNLRWNAFRLGVRLIRAAANPWSGLDHQAARTAQWQPEHPFGLPRWFPHKALGKVVALEAILMMRSVLRLADSYRKTQPASETQARRKEYATPSAGKRS